MLPDDTPEPRELLDEAIVTTVWDHPNPPDITGGAWLKLSKLQVKLLSCDECRSLCMLEDISGVVQISFQEDPKLYRMHLICRNCGPYRYRALALAYEWLADRYEDTDP
jgi:hypothetical protein